MAAGAVLLAVAFFGFAATASGPGWSVTTATLAATILRGTLRPTAAPWLAAFLLAWPLAGVAALLALAAGRRPAATPARWAAVVLGACAPATGIFALVKHHGPGPAALLGSIAWLLMAAGIIHRHRSIPSSGRNQ